MDSLWQFLLFMSYGAIMLMVAAFVRAVGESGKEPAYAVLGAIVSLAGILVVIAMDIILMYR